jgi:hypothetical protein
MSPRPFALSAALALALLPRAPARAEVVVYANDSAGLGGQIACQAGFAANEIGAAVFQVPPADGPVLLLEAQFFTCDGSGLGFAQARPVDVRVYGAGGPNPGAALYTSPLLSALPGNLNLWDVSAQQLGFASGASFTLGVRLANGNLFQNFTTLSTDTNGCQAGKNLLFAIPPSSWNDSCALGVSGDFLIRARVLTQGPKPYGSGLAGAAGVPQIGSSGPWNVGSTSFAVRCSSVAPGLPGALAFAAAPASLPLFGGTLLVDLAAPTIFPVLANGAGVAQKSIAIPALPSIAGVHAFFQFGFLDSAAPQGFALSSGLDVRVSPN